MQVAATISYPGASPEQVFTMLADPKFQEEKCAATGAISYDVDIAEVADTTVITCRRVLPTDDLPDFVRPFASGGLNLTETIAWSAPDSAGGRIGQVTLAFKSQPLSMRGELHMDADAEGTTAILQRQAGRHGAAARWPDRAGLRAAGAGRPAHRRTPRPHMARRARLARLGAGLALTAALFAGCTATVDGHGRSTAAPSSSSSSPRTASSSPSTPVRAVVVSGQLCRPRPVPSEPQVDLHGE